MLSAPNPFPRAPQIAPYFGREGRRETRSRYSRIALATTYETVRSSASAISVSACSSSVVIRAETVSAFLSLAGIFFRAMGGKVQGVSSTGHHLFNLPD